MRIGIIGVGRIGAFHARTLVGLPVVTELVLTDPVSGTAEALAAELGASVSPDARQLLGRGLDAVLITSATHTHAELLQSALLAGIPAFCEKPVAGTLDATIELARLEVSSGVPVQVGFQRRFDVGYQRLHDAIHSGELGFVHTIRAATHDQSPPPPHYLPTSGGLFQDAAIHDYDVIRYVTGREIASVYAVGANKGEKFFTEAGDIDTAAALLTLDDDTLVVTSVTRYNAAGHDIRMEVHGSQGALATGLDDRYPMSSAEPGATFPAGPAHRSFLERFDAAYRAEMACFVDVAQGLVTSRCSVRDALEAFRVAQACGLSRREGRRVTLTEIPGL